MKRCVDCANPTDQIRTIRSLGARRCCIDALYDVALAVGPIHDFDRLARLNDLAPRWILVDEADSRLDTWVDRIERHRVEAVERIARYFADHWVSNDDPGAAVDAVFMVAGQPIDVENLRTRWNSRVDASIASGSVRSPLQPTRWRRLALYVGAKSPRLSRFLRSSLRR